MSAELNRNEKQILSYSCQNGYDTKNSEDEHNALLQSHIKIYKRRWYILFIFTMLPFLHSYLYNTWPVIAISIRPVFGWSMSEISIMQIWFYAMFFVSVFPMLWLMQVKGMRASVIVCSACLVAATLLRCISMLPTAATWLNNIANCLIGVATPVAWVGAPVISALWFPHQQRSICTSIALVSGMLGSALSFITGPLYVSQPEKEHIMYNSSQQEYSNLGIIRSQIQSMRITECIVCALLFLATLIYFPNKPTLPPSNSSALPKMDFILSLKSLIRCPNVNFWLINLSCAIRVGFYGIWNALLVVNLGSLLPQFELGYLGCIANVCGFFSGIAVGRLSSKFPRHLKLVLVIMIFGAVLSTFWVLVIAEKYVLLSRVQIYCAILIQSICVNGPTGISIEMAIENNYPISETVTSGAIQLTHNVLPILFLCVFFVPNIGTSWINWMMFIGLVVSFFLVVTFKERYNRLSTDTRDINLKKEERPLPGNIVTAVH